MGIERLRIIASLNDKDKNFINHDLYRLLYDKELYVTAYENIKGNKGALTPGAEPNTLQGFSLEKIENLILQMRTQTWQPKAARQILIPKPGKITLRPLGIQGPEDKIVQEIVRMILEAIYENSFDRNSFGFRPNIGCHNALKYINQEFDGLYLAIEGDIQSFFPTVCHEILIKILSRRIKDQRFLDIIFKMLRAEIWKQNDGKFEKPDVGTPQGSIVSPMLSNIYLNELDIWIRKWINQNCENEHHLIKSDSVKKFNSILKRLEKEQRNNSSDKNLGNEIRKIKFERLKSGPYYDDSQKKERLVYVRYADDFIIGMNGSQEKAERLKLNLTEFLKNELELTLSQEKTKITDIRETPAIFLGHEVYINKSEKIKIIRPQGRTPYHRRTTGGFVKIEIPIQRVIDKLHLKGFCTKLGYPISNGRLTVYDDADIVLHYNMVLNGYLNFYSGTTKSNPKYRLLYIMKYSCAKTLAHKHKSTISKIFSKHGKHLTIKINIPSSNPSKTPIVKKVSLIPSAIMKRPKFQLGETFEDPYNIYLKKYTKSNLFSKCLICGSPDNIEMHHVKSIKNIQPKTFDQIHGYVKRKQIPLCVKHHKDVTYGRYDGISFNELLKYTQLTVDPHKIDQIEQIEKSHELERESIRKYSSRRQKSNRDKN